MRAALLLQGGQEKQEAKHKSLMSIRHVIDLVDFSCTSSLLLSVHSFPVGLAIWHQEATTYLGTPTFLDVPGSVGGQMSYPVQSMHFTVGFVWAFLNFRRPLAIPPGRNCPAHRWV